MAKPAKTVAREKPAARRARHEATHAAIKRAAQRAAPAPAPTPAKRTKAPAPIAAPVARPSPPTGTAPPAPPAAPRHAVPVGVYLDSNRHGAIVVKHTPNGVWYLTMFTGQITLEHCSEERFQRDFHVHLPLYPLRRAIRIYKESLLERDEQCDKVMHVILRDT